VADGRARGTSPATDDTQERLVKDEPVHDPSLEPPAVEEADDATALAADPPVADGVDGTALAADAPVADGADDTAAAAEVGPTDDLPADATGGDAPHSFVPEEVSDPDPRSHEELLAELGEAESRRDEYLDDLRRARAEFENFRRRTLREGGSQREAGKADVATGLLEVLDDLDRTLEAAEASPDESLAKGVSLVADKLVRSLQAVGLEQVARTGVAFDPNVHEAVQQRPAEEPREEPVVAEVLRPGYRLGDRVLRPAMVVVEQ
jgi:molecular chaperone GrpE